MNTLRRNRRTLPAFTLVEILVAIGIFLVLVSVTIPLAAKQIMGAYASDDQSAFVALLRSARDQAMANHYGQDTGVYVAPTTYTLFSGTSYQTRTVSRDVLFPRTNPLFPSPTEIRFQSPSGMPTIIQAGQTVSAVTFEVVDTTRARTLTISVNEEGQIDWNF